jgi:hypothetical protein
MFAKISLSLTAASILMVALMIGAPLAGASEGARPIAISALHTSISVDRSPSIVVAEDDDQSSDSADSDKSDSSDSSDSNDSSDSANDNQNDDSDQNGDSDQMNQQNAGNVQQAAPQVFQAPDSDAGEAGQAPLNSYPQQVNPNQ